VLDRVREGANVWFALPPGEEGALARDLIARLPAGDTILESDRRQAARVLAERARVASESFRNKGADWDEMRALDLPAQAVEQALLHLAPDAERGLLLDIGTGTGRVLELLAPHFRQGLGVDASKAMLALARARLAQPGLAHCAVRLADMYRLPLADASFDTAVLQMVLHYAEDPAGAMAEAARILRPGGKLIVIDLASHARDDLISKRAHRWPGFSDTALHKLLNNAGLDPGEAVTIPGPLDVRIWCATRMHEAIAEASLEPVN
jgi:ArsR family transcriptional regulator